MLCVLNAILSSARWTRLSRPLRYPMPNYPCDFELPDEWLIEAGMANFIRARTAFRSTTNAVLVPLCEIEPPYRAHSHPMDWRGFDRTRLISILRGIATEAEIEAVPLVQLPAGDPLAPTPYRYRVRDGVHRFYASIVAGFECLPATIKSLAELLELSRNLGWRE
jgi:hypothetical protein